MEAVIFDGFVKSPTSALCCISQSFNVQKVRLMITKFACLEFELFTKPSKSDFLRFTSSSILIWKEKSDCLVTKAPTHKTDFKRVLL
jgi:hypothetical protein